MLLARRGLALLLLGACGSTASGGAAGGGSSGGVCGSAPDSVVLQGGCPLELACPPIDRYGGGDGCDGGPLEGGAEYSAAEICVLQHLASGTPGKIVLGGVCPELDETITLSVVATGEAILVVESREPCEDCECGEVRRGWLPLNACGVAEVGLFAACLGETDPAGRVACMTPESWLVGCAPTEPRCVGR